MIREYPNGDKAEIKGLTVTVELGEESIGRIRKAALDEIDSLKAENDKLRELVIRMRPICIQGTRCTFADKLYISKAMEELGIEVTKNE